MQKRIIIKGAIGSNPRKDRDGFRVLGGGGMSVGLQAHISIEPPLVIKSYGKENTNVRNNG